MTTGGRLGQQTVPPNAAYAGQFVRFPDPVRAARHPKGVWVDDDGYPDFSPYARAAAEIAEPPDGFGVCRSQLGLGHRRHTTQRGRRAPLSLAL